MYQEYNPNPVGRKVGDCAVRVVAKALGKTWEQSYRLITDAGYRMDYDNMMAVVDELMEVLKATQPRLYEGVLRKMQE